MRSFTHVCFAAIAALFVSLASHSIPARAADVIFGYLPTWQADKAEGVDFAKYTHITIAFAIPDQNGHITMDNRDSMMAEWMPKLAEGHTKVLVSLGGWTGSKHFSPLLKDPKKRSHMIDEMTQWMQEFGFDGWDIDFEYPGRQGNSCHQFDAREDTPNFLLFLKDLRHRMDSEFGESTKLITIATHFQPFSGSQGPMSDVSEFANYVDYFNPMLYDFNGVWSDTTGPNAPLDYTKGKALQFSFKSSIQSWIDAGIPASKINAGLPFYGRTVTAHGDMASSPDMYQPLSKTIPRGDGDDKEESDISCGGPKLFSGIWKYANLRSEGVLDSPDSATAPWIRRYDNATNTPWLFNKETRDFVSYDDTTSINAKAGFAAEKGLAGVMIWPITNDYDNELVNAAQSAFNA
ncbi:hypothetical protein GGI18_000644 [Coemansia linderi]|uniref:Uncharacterized protein n=1 Tax=Coemansia linderi TaxID=2663919 RepID=A0ACC1KMT4_9FUNG|nr:hypothetical protein GGI18_000644 [Coemansia linderi]